MDRVTKPCLALALLLLMVLSVSCRNAPDERNTSRQGGRLGVALTSTRQPPAQVPTFTATATSTARPIATPTQTVEITPVPTQTLAPTPPMSRPPDRITAPRIGLDARVEPIGWHMVTAADGSSYSEWDVASFAAGWHKNSGLPGEGTNIVLSGHHNIDGEVFRYVVDLKLGDEVTLWEGDNRYDYIVQQTMIVQDKNVPYEQRLENALWLNPSAEERLTLVTCWPYTNNTHRVIVVGLPAGQP